MGTFNLFMYNTDENSLEEHPSHYQFQNPRMTRREMKEVQEEFQRQKKIYEQTHGVLMSEERKKALYK